MLKKIYDNYLIKKIYDNSSSDSWSTQLRKKRFALLNSLINSLEKDSVETLKILDVGGRPTFWRLQEGLETIVQNFKITIINLEQLSDQDFVCLQGDARDLNQFQQQEFDVVFSNSVIEHVGSEQDRLKMANEIKRVGKRYFIQTPNRYFPIEPHFVFPLFQFLPLRLQVWLISHFALGWYGKVEDLELAKQLCQEIQLLSKKELHKLFPEGIIYEEKILGLTKSFIVYHGW
ncbi:methyltransferase type 11 [Stanieria sp. NIES-3757]|nr:methyltransferase type 11 [Stanieria sp. NIES-3757]